MTPPPRCCTVLGACSVHYVMPGLQTLCEPGQCLGKMQPGLQAPISQHGAHTPSLRAREATKGSKKVQVMVQHSWVKNGLECRLLMQDQGGEGGREIACKYQRPRKALPCSNLLSGPVMADSRAGGEVMEYDVMSTSREVPQS